jgi:hypothetical protein
MRPLPTRSARGSALVFALCFVAVLAVAGVAILRIAGRDRVAAAQLGIKDRGLACAEAGLQHARRLLGTTYDTTGGWATYLADGSQFRYDPSLGDSYPSTFASATVGDADGDGQRDFWISVRDDDDEAPYGATDNRRRDNNEMIVVRSECINPSWQIAEGGAKKSVVLETMLVHIQSSSGYATSGPSNSADLVGVR